MSDYPTHWQIKNLEDVMEAIIDYRGKTPKKSSNGIPLITARVVKNGRFLPAKEFLEPDVYEKWMTRGFPKVGDVVLTTEAPLGEVAQIKDTNVGLAQRIITLRGKEGVLDNDYLLYCLQSPLVQHELYSRSTGTTVVGIKQKELKQVRLPIPPLAEQKKIAVILSNIDEKIDINEKLINELQTITKAYFNSLFVDFSPVKVKSIIKNKGYDDLSSFFCEAYFNGIVSFEELQGEIINIDALKESVGKVHSKNLGSGIAKLVENIPKQLINSDIGDIPEGWDKVSLGDFLSVKHGFAFKGEFFKDNESNNILLTPGNFNIGGGLKLNKVKYYDGPVPEEYILKQNDLIITMTDLSKEGDTLGFPALVYESNDKNYLHNQRLGKIELKNGYDELYLYFYHLLCTPAYRGLILGTATGSTVKHTSPGRIEEYEFCFSREIAEMFCEIFNPFYEMIENLYKESEELKRIKKSLLPPLMVGEISLG